MNFKYNAHIRPEMQQNIFILHLDTKLVIILEVYLNTYHIFLFFFLSPRKWNAPQLVGQFRQRLLDM